MISLDKITEKICYQNALKYPISQFKYFSMVKKNLDEFEMNIVELFELLNEKKTSFKFHHHHSSHHHHLKDENNEISKRQKIDTTITKDLINMEFERLSNKFKELSNKNEFGKESKTLELLQTYQNEIKNVDTDLPLFNFNGDFDRKLIYNFQLNLNAIYILFTVCKIWGNESPHTKKIAAATTTEIDEKVSKIIANMNKYLTCLM